MSLVGPVLAGVLADLATWRWCFYINLPVALPLSVIATPLVQNRRPNRRPEDWTNQAKFFPRLDVWGLLLLCPALISFMLAVGMGGVTSDWKSAATISLFSTAAVVFVLYVLIQSKDPNRNRIPLPAAKNGFLLFQSINRFFLAGAYVVIVSWLTAYFQVVKRATALESAVYQLPLHFFLGVFTLLGFLITAAKVHAPYRLIGATIGGSAFLAGAVLLSTLSAQTPVKEWIGYEILVGVGFGTMLVVLHFSVGAYLRSPTIRQRSFRVSSGSLGTTWTDMRPPLDLRL